MGDPEQDRQDPQSAAGEPAGPDAEALTPADGPIGAPVESSSEATARRLLAALLAGQGGPASPRRSRVEAGVIRVLIAEGSATEVAGFLAPVPGRPGEFEVAVEEVGPVDGGRISVQQYGSDVESAVREALRAAGQGASVKVTSVSGDLRRTVLRHSRTRSGALEFVPPTPDAYDGDGEAGRAAVEAWSGAAAALAVGLPAPTAGRGGAAAVDVSGPVAASGAATGGPADTGAAALDIAAAVTQAMAAVDLELDPTGIGAAVQQALADITIEVDLGAVEQAVRAGLADVRLDLDPAAIEAPLRRAVAMLLGLDESGPADTDPGGPLARRADLAGLAQSGELASLARRQDMARLARREDVAPLAHRDDLAPLAGREDLVPLARRDDLAPLARREDLIPLARDGEVAGAEDRARVESKLDRLLAVTASGQRSAPPAGPAELVALRRQVEELLQTLDERLAAGTRSIEALADELADRDRTATALAAELGRRTDAAVDRLAARLDGRSVQPGGRAARPGRPAGPGTGR